VINVKIANRCLWGLNLLLGLGIVLYSLQYLVFPPAMDLLKDIDRNAALASPAHTPHEMPREEALLTLRNPLRPAEAPTASPSFLATLKGVLPARDSNQGVAFIKVGDNELLVGMGEELLKDAGWRLSELWKDRAAFTNRQGERCELKVDAADPPRSEEQAKPTPRIGEPYSSLPR
jgi:hypothetical protein